METFFEARISTVSAAFIKNKQKNITVQLKAPQENEKILFSDPDNNNLLCAVKEVSEYHSLTEVLLFEGNKNILPDITEEIRSASELYAIKFEYLYDPDHIWNDLYDRAKAVLDPRCLTDMMDAGGVAAAVLSGDDHIYTGVCLDTNCSLGMCAERNALSTMITCGEQVVKKIICIGGQGNLMMPCGACREFIMQMDPQNRYAEFLEDRITEHAITLEALLPNWWG